MKNLQMIKQLQTVEVEKLKMNKQQELNQKKKIIQQEFDILHQTLKKEKEAQTKSLTAKESALKDIRNARDKVKEHKRELIDAQDQLS